MYVQMYKLNNSYTTYVVRDCLKSKASRGGLVSKSSNKQDAPQKLSEKTLLHPLDNSSLVKHKLYGIGKVIDTDVYGHMSVAFTSKTVKFIYPDAFKDGFLVIA